MNDRNIIGIVGIVGFAVIALTPIVPIMFQNYAVDNIYIIKAAIGFFSLMCGYAVIYGFFKKESPFPTKKEGKLRLMPIFMIAGVAIIALAWFSNLPQICSDYTGLAKTFSYGGETGLQGGIGVRVFTSILTAVGVLLCRFSFRREKRVIAETKNTEETFHKLMGGGGY